MTRNQTTHVMLFVAGVSIGTAVGILLAPASGRDTRRKVVCGAKSVRDLYEQSRHLADEAADLFEEGRKLVRG